MMVMLVLLVSNSSAMKKLYLLINCLLATRVVLVPFQRFHPQFVMPSLDSTTTVILLSRVSTTSSAATTSNAHSGSKDGTIACNWHRHENLQLTKASQGLQVLARDTEVGSTCSSATHPSPSLYQVLSYTALIYRRYSNVTPHSTLLNPRLSLTPSPEPPTPPFTEARTVIQSSLQGSLFDLTMVYPLTLGHPQPQQAPTPVATVGALSV